MLTTQGLLVGIYGPSRSALDAARQLVSGHLTVPIALCISVVRQIEAHGLYCCPGMQCIAPITLFTLKGQSLAQPA